MVLVWFVCLFAFCFVFKERHFSVVNFALNNKGHLWSSLAGKSRITILNEVSSRKSWNNMVLFLICAWTMITRQLSINELITCCLYHLWNSHEQHLHPTLKKWNEIKLLYVLGYKNINWQPSLLLRQENLLISCFFISTDHNNTILMLLADFFHQTYNRQDFCLDKV